MSPALLSGTSFCLLPAGLDGFARRLCWTRQPTANLGLTSEGGIVQSYDTPGTLADGRRNRLSALCFPKSLTTCCHLAAAPETRWCFILAVTKVRVRHGVRLAIPAGHSGKLYTPFVQEPGKMCQKHTLIASLLEAP